MGYPNRGRFVLERVTQPDIEPVTLAETRRHLKCFDDVTVEDDDITALIQGGREWVEQETGRALIDQQWRLTLTDKFQSADSVTTPSYYYGPWGAASEILLRRSPVLSIVSFVSVDAAGAETTIDSSLYELREKDSKWPKLVGLNGSFWQCGTFRILMRAGYANRDVSPAEGEEVVPVRFRQAIKLWVEANYFRGDNADKLLEVACSLIDAERCHFGLG